jgi:hypothetical protein
MQGEVAASHWEKQKKEVWAKKSESGSRLLQSATRYILLAQDSYELLRQCSLILIIEQIAAILFV